ncbi:MAG: general secretion pathway protein D [Shewanella psychromarinicola]|jgi:general secretion pathway protein D|uniref:type II secretion system secretin GspD n=1 Tax=Shewanella psychromarinicola TaxID=2487742 RepID=UPI003EEB7451
MKSIPLYAVKLCALLLVSCSAPSPKIDPLPIDSAQVSPNTQIPATTRITVDGITAENKKSPDNEGANGTELSTNTQKNRATFYRGDGKLFNQQLAAKRDKNVNTGEGDISLQFNQTDISEVVRTIFGELLNETYIISPNVQGKITFSTAKPINKDQLIYTLETLLNWNALALIFREGIYHIIPIQEAIMGNITPSTGALPQTPSYEVQIIPLQYITASQLVELLRPFLKPNALIHTDDARRMIMLAGSPDQLRNYLNTIKIFDVNWLKGMSVGIFSLEVTDPNTMIQEINQLLNIDNSPMRQQIRLMPMERINSIVAVTAQPEYLQTIQQWVERLDQQVSKIKGQNLYVYNVENVDADKLTGTLNSIFDDQSGTASTQNNTNRRLPPASNVTPGMDMVRITRDGTQAINSPSGNDNEVSLAVISQGDISFTAIAENNSLLIKASPTQYRTILNAIKQLDVMPLQVLIEANILEVTLSDGLSYGVEWFLNNATEGFTSSNNAEGNGFLSLGTAGLSYRIANDRIGAAISALKTSGKTKVLSSPTLWALNNEAASITVGTQIPVNTTSINTSGSGDTITSEVQFRDTGVILNVTPRINPGGLVFLDVSQNISTPTGGADSNGNVSISQREISTKVAVDSGQTVLLGGLISETQVKSRQGVPLLSDIPILGHLFSSNSTDTIKTEIIVSIKPTVINSKGEFDALTEEYRRRFKHINPIIDNQATQKDSKLNQRSTQ